MLYTNIVITLERETIRQPDGLVKRQIFPNRSRAIQEAVQEKIARLRGGRLATECARLDPKEEQALAEEGMAVDGPAWPKF